MFLDNMDGYTLMEQMRRARRRNRLTATEQTLFYELVAVCNSEGWEDVFSCSNIELCCSLNIDEKTLVRARLSLINAGLVYYKSGKSRRVVGLYSFSKKFKDESPKKKPTTGKNTVDVPTEKPTEKKGDTPADAPTNMGANQPADAPDYIKTKTETKLKELSLSLDELSFISFEFLDVFLLWLEYKKERREKYKSDRSVKACYDKLVRLSGNDANVANEIVNQSIANNWAGLFELKNNCRNGNKEQTNDVDQTTIIIRKADI